MTPSSVLPDLSVNDKYVKLIFYIYIFMWAFDGINRYFLYTAGIPAAIYIRDILPIAALYLMFMSHGIDLRIKKNILIYSYFLFFFFTVGVFFDPGLIAALFGLKTMLPIIYGIAFYHVLYKIFYTGSIFFPTILYLTLLGTILDILGLAPWRGSSFLLEGVMIETGFDNQTGGFSRIIGFSRTNFQLAILATLISLFCALQTRKRILKLVYLGIGGFIVLSSTTKGIMGFYILAMILLIGLTLLPRLTNLGSKIIIPVTIGLGFYMPFTALDQLIYHDLFSQNLFNAFDSLFIRFERGWPMAIDYIQESGAWLFGGGLGVLGAADTTFNYYHKGTVDSFYLFFLGTFGIPGFLWLLMIAFRARKIALHFDPISLFSFLIIWLALLFGIVSTSIENALLLFFVGAAIMHLYIVRSPSDRIDLYKRYHKPFLTS